MSASGSGLTPLQQVRFDAEVGAKIRLGVFEDNVTRPVVAALWAKHVAEKTSAGNANGDQIVDLLERKAYASALFDICKCGIMIVASDHDVIKTVLDAVGKALNDASTRLKQNTADFKQITDTADKVRSSIEAEIAQTEAQITVKDTLRGEYEREKKAFINAEASLAEHNKNLDTTVKTIGSKTAAVTDVEKKKSVLKPVLENPLENGKEGEHAVEQVMQQCSELLDTFVQKTNAEVAELEALKTTIEGKIEEATGAVEAAKATMEVSDGNVKAVTDEISQLKQMKKSKTKSLSDHEKKVASAEVDRQEAFIVEAQFTKVLDTFKELQNRSATAPTDTNEDAKDVEMKDAVSEGAANGTVEEAAKAKAKPKVPEEEEVKDHDDDDADVLTFPAGPGRGFQSYKQLISNTSAMGVPVRNLLAGSSSTATASRSTCAGMVAGSSSSSGAGKIVAKAAGASCVAGGTSSTDDDQDEDDEGADEDEDDEDEDDDAPAPAAKRRRREVVLYPASSRAPANDDLANNLLDDLANDRPFEAAEESGAGKMKAAPAIKASMKKKAVDSDDESSNSDEVASDDEPSAAVMKAAKNYAWVKAKKLVAGKVGKKFAGQAWGTQEQRNRWEKEISAPGKKIEGPDNSGKRSAKSFRCPWHVNALAWRGRGNEKKARQLENKCKDKNGANACRLLKYSAHLKNCNGVDSVFCHEATENWCRPLFPSHCFPNPQEDAEAVAGESEVEDQEEEDDLFAEEEGDP